MNSQDRPNAGANARISPDDLARDYVEGVRGLFAAPQAFQAAPAERGERPPAAAPQVADRAEALSPVSTKLTKALSRRLRAKNMALREQSSEKLLAKALTDLQVSQQLYAAASSEEEGSSRSFAERDERAGAPVAADEEALQILLVGPESRQAPAARAFGRGTANIDAAKAQLSTAAQDTLDTIVDRAAKTGRSALGGVLGLGAVDLANAVGMVGMGIAGALGQADNLSRLYNLCRTFLANAFDALLALVGKSVAQSAASQLLNWFDDLKQDALFKGLLARLYDTEDTGKEINDLVQKSKAAADRFNTTTDKVKALGDKYSRQLNIAGKIVSGVKFVGALPLKLIPQGAIVLAAIFIILGSYVVLAGADYADAQHFRRLDRVAGVKEVVTSELAH